MAGGRPLILRRARRGSQRRIVLVSDHVDGRSRSAVAAVRALGAAGFRPVVTVSGKPSAAGASRYCAGRLQVPPVADPGFRQAVEDYLRADPSAAILPASDAVLAALDHAGAQLIDKTGLAKRALAAGAATPPTEEFIDSDEVRRVAGRLDYPLIVKPAVKSRPTEVARRVDRPEDLAGALVGMPGALVVQPLVAGTMRAVCGVLLQGQLRAVVHQRYQRIWPPDCGTASAAVTTTPDLDLEARLPDLLAGHEGVFQVQLIEDLVIDINPRVYGSLPLAVAAGANLPAIACAPAGEPDRIPLVRGRPGVRYRWLEGDARRLVHDVRSGHLSLTAATRALAPRGGTAHSVESLSDPGPFLVRALDVVHRRLS